MEFEAMKENEEWMVIHMEKKALRQKDKTARREAELNAQARLDNAWTVQWDASYKRFYFWNQSTNASSWTAPTPAMADEEEAAWAKVRYGIVFIFLPIYNCAFTFTFTIPCSQCIYMFVRACLVRRGERHELL